MEKLRWYFKHGTKFEEFSVLYDDDKFILVQNDNTQNYSYGLKSDFGTLYGFPVNQSCLNMEQANDMLHAFVEIDKKYLDTLGEIAEVNIKRCNNMIEAITRYKNVSILWKEYRIMRVNNNCNTCKNLINEICQLEENGCQTSMYEQYESNQDYFECMNDYNNGSMQVEQLA